MDLWIYLLCAIVAVLVLMVLTLLGVAVYSGLLHNIEISVGKPHVSNVTVAYKFDRGPYTNCGYLFSETHSLAPKLRCIGIYYDDPDEVPAEKLRWAVGSILAEGSEKLDEGLVKLFEGRGFKLFNLPAVTQVVRTTFPYKTFLSIYIAVYRVYAAIGQYYKDSGLNASPWMEIYDGLLIKYMAPLELHDQFFVPEAVAAANDLTTTADTADAAVDGGDN